jgi:hypothetical protein
MARANIPVAITVKSFRTIISTINIQQKSKFGYILDNKIHKWSNTLPLSNNQCDVYDLIVKY